MNVVFIQPSQFLRSSKKTNQFFDPIIKCIENEKEKSGGIEWSIYLPKNEKSGYASEHVHHYGAIEFFSIWFWRIVHVMMPWMPIWKVYYVFGKLSRIFLTDWAKADIIITIAGIFADIFAGAFPNKRIVDLQHGVIYSKHTGYFDEKGRILEQYRKYAKREFWVYGQGYADCFFNHPDNIKYLQGRVKIIGDVQKHQIVQRHPCDVLVISGQFKPECSRQCMLEQVSALRKFLLEVKKLGTNRFQVLMKHHPRFKGISELNDLYREFPFFSETNEGWNELYKMMKVHVTFSSTVVLDAASNGILSYLIEPPNDDVVLENRFWRDDYQYPYYGKSLQDIIALSDEPQSEETIKSWYNQYYEPFSFENCQKLLSNKIRS